MWPLSCFARFNVNTTNWLPTGIQGAKEPLDGQRLEVYPAINVSKSLACVIHRNQPSSLELSRKERDRFTLSQHQLTSVCTLPLSNDFKCLGKRGKVSARYNIDIKDFLCNCKTFCMKSLVIDNDSHRKMVIIRLAVPCFWL